MLFYDCILAEPRGHIACFLKTSSKSICEKIPKQRLKSCSSSVHSRRRVPYPIVPAVHGLTTPAHSRGYPDHARSLAFIQRTNGPPSRQSLVAISPPRRTLGSSTVTNPPESLIVMMLSTSVRSRRCTTEFRISTAPSRPKPGKTVTP